jgi:hypothetical protein
VRDLVAEATPSTARAAEPAFLATPPIAVDEAARSLIATPSDVDASARSLIATPSNVDAAARSVVAAPANVANNAANVDVDASARSLIASPIANDGAPTSQAIPSSTTSGATTLPVRAGYADDALTKPFIRPEAHVTPPITVSEGEHTSVSVSDVVTVRGTADTAVVTASPRVLISETASASPIASVTPAVSVSSTIERDDATPEATDDEPSDGVIRAAIATADTARVAARARALRAVEPEHDGPPVKETTGEIGDVRVRTGVQEKIELEPSILVNDLAAAHTAVAAAAKRAKTAPPLTDAASASKELDVATVRRDAVAFSAEEEEFFKRAESGTAQVPKLESFDDLDDGYQPRTFWGRVFGKNDKKKPPPR